jgi:D-alanyl-D-alanine dipeptidase
VLQIQRISLFSILLFFCSHLFGQGSYNNGNTALRVLKDPKIFSRTVTADPDNAMVDVRKLVPSVVLDLRYATQDNFTGVVLYPPLKTTYLRKPAAEALKAVEEALMEKKLGLKLFDAYRPYSVTVKMWDLVHDERYVADPKKASGHNRGIAADLTLIHLSTGEPLNMGTGFDNFTDSAHHSFMSLSQDVLDNRKLLKSVMEEHGFKALETEWWHYAFQSDKVFEPLDISFQDLRKMNKGNRAPKR